MRPKLAPPRLGRRSIFATEDCRRYLVGEIVNLRAMRYGLLKAIAPGVPLFPRCGTSCCQGSGSRRSEVRKISDRAYYERRAKAELEKAELMDDPIGRKVHLALAAQYSKLAREMNH